MVFLMKKALKVIGVIAAIAGVIAGVYAIVKKYMEKKQQIGNTEENYVSCSCCDEDFISETTVA